MSDVDSMFATVFGQSCYKVPAARMTPYGVRLDTCPPTATRAPAMCNGHAMMEAMMQQAVAELSLTPLQLRENNLIEQGDPIMPPPQTLEDPSPIKDIIAKAKASADWEARNQQIEEARPEPGPNEVRPQPARVGAQDALPHLCLRPGWNHLRSSQWDRDGAGHEHQSGPGRRPLPRGSHRPHPDQAGDSPDQP